MFFNNQLLLCTTCHWAKSLLELIMLKQIEFREGCAESEIWGRKTLLYTVTKNGCQYSIRTTKKMEKHTKSICAPKRILDDSKFSSILGKKEVVSWIYKKSWKWSWFYGFDVTTTEQYYLLGVYKEFILKFYRVLFFFIFMCWNLLSSPISLISFLYVCTISFS